MNLNIAARLCIATAAIYGATAVALGAYASHGLNQWASATQVENVQLAVQYQLIHALVLFACGLLSTIARSRFLFFSQIAFSVGILLFSGSVYLSLFNIPKGLMLLTPVGGLLMILAWCALFISVLKK